MSPSHTLATLPQDALPTLFTQVSPIAFEEEPRSVYVSASYTAFARSRSEAIARLSRLRVRLGPAAPDSSSQYLLCAALAYADQDIRLQSMVSDVDTRSVRKTMGMLVSAARDFVSGVPGVTSVRLAVHAIVSTTIGSRYVTFIEVVAAPQRIDAEPSPSLPALGNFGHFTVLAGRDSSHAIGIERRLLDSTSRYPLGVVVDRTNGPIILATDPPIQPVPATPVNRWFLTKR